MNIKKCKYLDEGTKIYDELLDKNENVVMDLLDKEALVDYKIYNNSLIKRIINKKYSEIYDYYAAMAVRYGRSNHDLQIHLRHGLKRSLAIYKDNNLPTNEKAKLLASFYRKTARYNPRIVALCKAKLDYIGKNYSDLDVLKQ